MSTERVAVFIDGHIRFRLDDDTTITVPFHGQGGAVKWDLRAEDWTILEGAAHYAVKSAMKQAIDKVKGLRCLGSS